MTDLPPLHLLIHRLLPLSHPTTSITEVEREDGGEVVRKSERGEIVRSRGKVERRRARGMEIREGMREKKRHREREAVLSAVRSSCTSQSEGQTVLITLNRRCAAACLSFYWEIMRMVTSPRALWGTSPPKRCVIGARIL